MESYSLPLPLERRQRLQRKLLGGRALREAEREASAVDDERHRDTYGSSRWENK
jgi:hypothetical protein